MFGDMMEKIQQMKQNVADVKDKLDRISVTGESANGKVRVVCNGNKVVKSFHIDESLKNGDAEELEDHLILATNRAIEKAENLHQSEMAAVTSGMIPPHLMGLMNQ
jgi:DNA-binding YbaB/EbfC family protein